MRNAAAAFSAAIPLAARIVAVADVFDSLTRLRPYKAATPLDQSLAILQAERGRHFDPACLDVFLRAVAELAGSPPDLAVLRHALEQRYADACATLATPATMSAAATNRIASAA